MPRDSYLLNDDASDILTLILIYYFMRLKMKTFILIGGLNPCSIKNVRSLEGRQ
jgi:hypothetical protein